MLLPTLALLALPTAAQDTAATTWREWRGPLATGEAPGADPPLTWSEEQNVLWKTPLPGHGKSTPIIDAGRIYLLAALPTREASAEELAQRPALADQRTEAPNEVYAFLALALDQKSGEVLWETTLTERLPLGGVHSTNGYASFSPVTDGERLYVSFGSNGVFALDAASGDVLWSYDVGPQRTRRGWGEGGAPALAGDALIVVADQEDQSRIHAIDAATGEARWTRERDEVSTWTVPLVLTAGGAQQIVVNGTGAVRAYDAKSGADLWWCSGQASNSIPAPVSDGTLVVCASGYRGSACIAMALDQRGDLTSHEAGVAWQHSGGTPYVPSPLLVDGRLYLVGGNSGMLSCLDFASGEVLVDRMRLELGNVYASPLAAGGRIYVVDREGRTVVLSHGEELEELAYNQLDEPIDASPVALGDVLYLRSESSLYAIAE